MRLVFSMAFYNPITINVFCSYLPCGYTGERHFHDRDKAPITSAAFDHCPKCNAFTLHKESLGLDATGIDESALRIFSDGFKDNIAKRKKESDNE